jgi:hypothetical protein
MKRLSRDIGSRYFVGSPLPVKRERECDVIKYRISTIIRVLTGIYGTNQWGHCSHTPMTAVTNVVVVRVKSS